MSNISNKIESLVESVTQPKKGSKYQPNDDNNDTFIERDHYRIDSLGNTLETESKYIYDIDARGEILRRYQKFSKWLSVPESKKEYKAVLVISLPPDENGKVEKGTHTFTMTYGNGEKVTDPIQDWNTHLCLIVQNKSEKISFNTSVIANHLRGIITSQDVINDFYLQINQQNMLMIPKEN